MQGEQRRGLKGNDKVREAENGDPKKGDDSRKERERGSSVKRNDKVGKVGCTHEEWRDDGVRNGREMAD